MKFSGFCLTIFATFILFSSYAQETKKPERILYILDTVPIIDDPDESEGALTNNDMYTVKVVTNKDSIGNLGYTSIDKVIFITTKEYHNRSEETKKIPTTKLMEKKDGVWYLKDTKTPYSGKFIDYFLNGKM